MGAFFTRWKIIVEKISDFQIKVLFSIIYLFLIIPTGMIAVFFLDFLNTKKRNSNWSKVQARSSSLEEMKLQ